MKDKWEKLGKVIHWGKPPCIRQEITYGNPRYPGWKIISVEHEELHANGKGSWAWTSYIALSSVRCPVKEFSRLMDAKDYVRQQYLGSTSKEG